MSLPEHLRAAIESPECPPGLSSFEKVVWAAERRKMYEDSDVRPVQPRTVKDPNLASSEEEQQ